MDTYVLHIYEARILIKCGRIRISLSDIDARQICTLEVLELLLFLKITLPDIDTLQILILIGYFTDSRKYIYPRKDGNKRSNSKFYAYA
jgi:hypothetical protein